MVQAWTTYLLLSTGVIAANYFGFRLSGYELFGSDGK